MALSSNTMLRILTSPIVSKEEFEAVPQWKIFGTGLYMGKAPSKYIDFCIRLGRLLIIIMKIYGPQHTGERGGVLKWVDF